jgi:energy-coupling factor transporter ATP-binding protein EcfA2
MDKIGFLKIFLENIDVTKPYEKEPFLKDFNSFLKKNNSGQVSWQTLMPLLEGVGIQKKTCYIDKVKHKLLILENAVFKPEDNPEKPEVKVESNKTTEQLALEALRSIFSAVIQNPDNADLALVAVKGMQLGMKSV